jgi:hypothetical protein
MSERINRKDDRRVYQPKIHVKRIHQLHELSVVTGKPQTVLVEEALAQYLAQLPEAREEIQPDYNPWDDAEDLTTYLEPYQND